MILSILFSVCRVGQLISSKSTPSMCTSIYSLSILWIAIFTVESLVIILVNIVTIIVFWKRRSQLKRTSYLLINLSVADLMIGVGNIENVGNGIWRMMHLSCKTPWEDYIALDELFGCASITFLVLISLERMYAIVWPFRMRATSTRTYIYSIAVAWAVSGISVGVQVLLKFSPAISITEAFNSWFPSVYMFVSLLILLCAYSIIWFCSRKEDPRLPLNRHKGNKDLAKTLFIVTVLSLITWLPISVVFHLRSTLTIFDSARCLQLANSFINPIVYCFRMPMFRSTLKTMFLKKSSSMGIRIQGREHQTHFRDNSAPVLLSVSTLNEAPCNIKHKHNDSALSCL